MLSPLPPGSLLSGPQPPCTYYQLLGISPNEQDPRVIEEAALGRSGHVRSYQLTREAESAQRLSEIAQALITLLDPARRRDYDLLLGAPPGPAAFEEGTLELLIHEGGACDVRLVYQDCARRAGSR
jgi:hypothetical protein